MILNQISMFFLCIGSALADENQDLFSKFFQYDYSIKDYRVDGLNYNKHFIEDMLFVYRKYNRSTKAANITMLTRVDLTNNSTSGFLLVYKRYGNEFKTFGLGFSFGLCTMLEKGIFGFSDTTCGKILCPIIKNVRQTMCNWIPDFSRLPPMVPDGEYKVKYNTTYQNKFLYEAVFYGTVYRKVKIPNL